MSYTLRYWWGRVLCAAERHDFAVWMTPDRLGRPQWRCRRCGELRPGEPL